MASKSVSGWAGASGGMVTDFGSSKKKKILVYSGYCLCWRSRVKYSPVFCCYTGKGALLISPPARGRGAALPFHRLFLVPAGLVFVRAGESSSRQENVCGRVRRPVLSFFLSGCFSSCLYTSSEVYIYVFLPCGHSPVIGYHEPIG